MLVAILRDRNAGDRETIQGLVASIALPASLSPPIATILRGLT
jgi:hypothetical protein